MFIQKKAGNLTNWDNLIQELDIWNLNDRAATLWWRDDDAIEPTGELDRLLDICEETKTPLALAVIPHKAGERLKYHLANHGLVSILVHGYAHTNHAPPGEKSMELGLHRDRDIIMTELAEGLRRLSDFNQAQPVLVPPWNRIDDALLHSLPPVGIKAVSGFRAREKRHPVPGLYCVNTHLDIIDWRRERRFMGVSDALAHIVGHLAARRSGQADPHEPTGILTHHLDHDEECWTFLRDFFHCTRNHPAVRWCAANELWS